jgi:hypothetical protein
MLFIVILLNLIIVCFLSTIAGVVSFLLGHPFFVGFGLCFIAAWCHGWSWNVFSTKFNQAKYKEIALLERIEKQGGTIEIPCSYCNVLNHAQIRLNTENEFVCLNCNNKNKINIAFSTSRTNSPVLPDTALQEIFNKIAE